MAAGTTFSLPTRARWLAVLAAALFLIIHSVPARAAVCNPNIATQTAFNIGAWQRPASGSDTADITTSDAVSGTGTPLFGTPVHGRYTLTTLGACTGTLTVSVTDSGGAAGISLSNFHLLYDGVSIANGASGLVLPGTAGKILDVGLTETYASTVSTGSKAPKFTIVITDSGTGNNQTTAESATIRIDVPVTVTKVQDINFGTVTAGNASTYRMATNSTASVVSGTGQLFSTGLKAANLNIKGSSSGGITIQAFGYTANNGVTPSNATCAYNGGAAVACTSAITGAAPTTAGKTLLVGVDVATDGTQATNTTAAPSFTINVDYQ